MSATIRTAIGIVVGLFVLYYLIALFARSVLHIEVPDPADLLPYDLRRLLR